MRLRKVDLLPAALLVLVGVCAWLLSGCAPEPVPVPAPQLSPQEIALRHQEAVALYNIRMVACQPPTVEPGTPAQYSCIDRAQEGLARGDR